MKFLAEQTWCWSAGGVQVVQETYMTSYLFFDDFLVGRRLDVFCSMSTQQTYFSYGSFCRNPSDFSSQKKSIKLHSFCFVTFLFWRYKVAPEIIQKLKRLGNGDTKWTEKRIWGILLCLPWVVGRLLGACCWDHANYPPSRLHCKPKRNCNEWHFSSRIEQFFVLYCIFN